MFLVRKETFQLQVDSGNKGKALFLLAWSHLNVVHLAEVYIAVMSKDTWVKVREAM